MTDQPTRHTFGLALLQYRIERTLSEWVGEHEVPIYRSREVTGFTSSDDAVHVELSDGSTLRAQYLVGCDGGRSLTRKIAGIDFPGWDPSTSCLVADVQMTEEPEWGIHRQGALHSIFKFEEDGPVRVLVTEAQLGRMEEPTLRDLSEALLSARGTDYGIHSPTWISRFTDVTRQAATYRKGRVLLAGDAAHVHFPIGGQGLNTGMQDAVNLGWKLAQVVNGTSPENLLDTYHAERHPVAARVLHNTMAQTALSRPGERVDALRDIMSDLLTLDMPRRRIAAMMSGLDIHYDMGPGHPLLGRRMPDLEVRTAQGALCVFTLLHEGRGVLLNLGTPITGASGWSHRVDIFNGRGPTRVLLGCRARQRRQQYVPPVGILRWIQHRDQIADARPIVDIAHDLPVGDVFGDRRAIERTRDRDQLLARHPFRTGADSGHQKSSLHRIHTRLSLSATPHLHDEESERAADQQ